MKKKKYVKIDNMRDSRFKKLYVTNFLYLFIFFYVINIIRVELKKETFKINTDWIFIQKKCRLEKNWAKLTLNIVKTLEICNFAPCRPGREMAKEMAKCG